MTFLDHLPALLLVLPLAAAFAAPLAARAGRRPLEVLFLGTCSLVALSALALQIRAAGGAPLIYVMGGDSALLPLPSGATFPIRILLELDAAGAFMALIGSVAALAGAIFSMRFLDRFSGYEKFVSLYLLTEAGALGMVATGDLFNFFVFLEISSVASYGLIAFYKDRPEALEAAFKYMLVSTLAALLVLFAIGFLYGRYGRLNLAALGAVLRPGTAERLALALFVASLAMKCGAVPMHFWTPDAYAEAPAPATCLLVATSQASLFGLFRIAYSLYGTTVGGGVVPWTLIVMGCLSMFVGVTMAVVQKDFMRLIAYHSVSQTGYMLLGLGVGLLCLSDAESMAEYGFTALQGGLYHLANYTLYKGMLFLGGGALVYAARSRNLNDLGGLARNLPVTAALFAFAAAAIAGLPPTNGFVSKWLLYESSFALSPLLPAIAMTTSILTLASFLKVFQTAFLGPPRSALAGVREVPRSMIVGTALLGATVLLLSLFPSAVLDGIIAPAARALVDRAGYMAAVLGGI
jgi:multicomponent Na+:H+ antiporter subunit D